MAVRNSTRRQMLLQTGALGLLWGCRSAVPLPEDSSPATPTAAAPSPTPSPSPTAGPAVRRGTLIGNSRFLQGGNYRYALALIDLDAEPLQVRPIEMQFFGHGLAFDPNDPTRALVFEKKGAGCCEVDLVAGKVLRPVATSEGRQFYGHGAFSADGSLLYCTEAVVGDGSFRGVIQVRDGETLEPVGELPSFGEAPHDCHIIEGGETMVVTNGGGSRASGREPNTAWIDLDSQTLIRKLPFTNLDANAGHVAIAESGDAVVVSAPREGLDIKDPAVHGDISFWHGERGPEAKLVAAADPITARMRAETLSLAIDERSGVVGATNPEGNLLTFWELGSGKLIEAHDELPMPRGIALTLDGAAFAVGYGPGSSLALLDAKTRAPLGGLEQGWMSGSHVVVHRLPRS